MNLPLKLFGQLIFLCLFSFAVEAQKPLLRRYDVADGLANSVVNSIYQDRKGFIWFATGEGLSRFDGYGFVNYDVRDGLGQQIINDVAEDKQGRLWAATNGGGVSLLIDRQRDIPESLKVETKKKFVSFRVSDKSKANQVNKIHFDSHNNLWCLTDFGLFRASLDDIANLKFEPIIDKYSANSHSLLEDSHGRIWCGLDLELFEISGGKVINHGAGSDGAGLHLGTSGESGNFITGIVETKDRKLLVSTLAALYELNPTNEKNGDEKWLRQQLMTDGQKLDLMFQDSSGSLWFSFFDEDFKTTIYQDGKQKSFLELRGRDFRDIVEDNEGNLWFGTWGVGVYKYSGEAFVNYENPTDSEPLIAVNVFENYDGRIFGILNHKSMVEITESKVGFSAKADYITSIPPNSFQINKDGLNVGYPIKINSPVIRLRNGQLVPLNKFLTIADLNKGIYFYEDENSTLWLVKEYKEIYRLDVSQSLLAHVATVTNSLFREHTVRIISDRKGGLWMSDAGNLCRLRDAQIKCFQPSDGLPAIQPRSIFVDSRGWLWIGSRYNGVSVTKNPGDAEPKFFNYVDEFPSKTVWAIAEDDTGKMYFGTERGVAQFEIGKQLWRNFNSKNGLSGDRVTALNRDSRGNIWISAATGLTKFNPKAERVENKPPPIYLTRVNIAGEDLPMAEAGVREISLIELPAASDNLLIEFVGLHYTGADDLIYQFKLEGIDADWGAPTKQRIINYARLGAGNYRFLVRAINREGLVSVTPASFEFRILSPLYLRWWFIGLALLTVGLMIYFFYRYRVQRLLEIERTRTRIATDLHDDIGTNLSKISLLSEIVNLQLVNGDEKNKEMLSSIAEISRESIASMSDIVWAINPHRDSSEELTSRMREHAEEIFVEKGVRVLFDTSADDKNIKLSMDTRRELFLIFKEAIANAAKHSHCSQIKIDFYSEQNSILLQIRDDGDGFDLSQKNDGNGLINMERRAKQIGGHLTVESRIDEGTMIKIKFLPN